MRTPFNRPHGFLFFFPPPPHHPPPPPPPPLPACVCVIQKYKKTVKKRNARPNSLSVNSACAIMSAPERGEGDSMNSAEVKKEMIATGKFKTEDLSYITDDFLREAGKSSKEFDGGSIVSRILLV